VTGQTSCAAVLKVIGRLAAAGYLAGAHATSRAFFAQTCSTFVGGISTATADSAGGATGTKRALAAGTAAPSSAPLASLSNSVATAVAGLTEGSLAGMVAGEAPTAVVTSNLRASMSFSLLTDIKGVLSPPQTDAERAYGASRPAIFIPPTSLSACDSGGGYAKMSTVGFGTNPNPGSAAVKSSLLQFTSHPSPTAAVAPLAATGAVRSSTPAYYVTLQFTAPAAFNRTAVSKQHSPKNFTVPACSIYNGVAYVSCGRCNYRTGRKFLCATTHRHTHRPLP
jgi:hypothetical protein